MDLSFYKSYPEIKRYQNSDCKDVLDLLAESPMLLGQLKLFYDRSPDFQSLLRAQAPEYHTFLGRSLETHELMGFASLSQSTRYLNGQLRPAIYLADLRTKISRRAAVIWRSAYPKLLLELQTQNSAGIFMYTAILKNNVQALRNLVKKGGEHQFHYHFLKELQMVNVFARLPWFYRISLRFKFFLQGRKKMGPHLTVRNVLESESKQLREWLIESNRKIQLGFDFFTSEWDHREKNWKQFAASNFLVAVDEKNLWMGVCLPFKPTDLKRMRVNSIPKYYKLLFKISRLFGLNPPSSHSDIETLYLSSFHCKTELRGPCLNAFLNFLTDCGALQSSHMISFCQQFARDFPTELASNFVFQKTAVLLFEVTTNPVPTSDFSQTEVGYEMAVI